MKCLRYKTATSSTNKINVPNSKFVILFHIHYRPSHARKTKYQCYMTWETLKNYVWNSYVLMQGKGAGGHVTNIYTHTHTQFTHQYSIIWRHLKYINTQNPPKCTFITWYEWSWPSIKLHQCTVVKLLKFPRDRNTTFVNSDNSKYNAP